MKKILIIGIIAGFGLTSCGKTICDAYSHNYKKDKTIKTAINKVIKDASAEA